MNSFFIGMIVFALIGGTSSAMSILPRFSKGTNVVPMSEAKSERTIRCKGEAKVDDTGRITSCSEGLYLAEESMNKHERKMTLKEKIINFLSKLQGMFFFLVVGSIVAVPFGFGGLVGKILEGIFGASAKALKVTVKAIGQAKKNNESIMSSLDSAHSADKKVQLKINELRAKT